MKSNQKILSKYPLFFIEDAPQSQESVVSKEDALSAMKEAQIEAIKTLVKRRNENNGIFVGVYRKLDDLALELIKEIEDGTP